VYAQGVRLEDQIAALADVGLPLEHDVTVDDILLSFDRAAYEAKPFELILFMLGAEVECEPWGRPICPRAWSFDTECIVQTGDYVAIVRQLCRIAGDPNRLGELRDEVDLEADEAWLSYTCDGTKRHYPVEVNDDWADTLTLCYVMADIERDGKRFYFKDNGQGMIYYYLAETDAERLAQLSPTPITRVIPP
jgi:hypothetical protein